VSVYNARTTTVLITAPGVRISVACGDSVQIHPQGDPPWNVTVTSAKGAQTVSVAKSGDIVFSELDGSGREHVTVDTRAGHGPPMVCPTRS